MTAADGIGATAGEAAASLAASSPHSARSMRRRAAQAANAGKCAAMATKIRQLELHITELHAVFDALHSSGEASTSLSRRLQAIAPALAAQEAAAAEGSSCHAPRLLIGEAANRIQVAAKHLFPGHGEKPWYTLSDSELKCELRSGVSLAKVTDSAASDEKNNSTWKRRWNPACRVCST